MAATGATPKGQLPAAADRALSPVREAGDMAAFSGRAIVHAAGAWRYFAEILRQCAILIVGSTLLLVALVFLIGAECGLFTTYLLRPIGASALSGLNLPICGLREMFPYMFAYIFAAKVGCGLTAEIGSMRISEELDAMQTQGIDPARYVVATRLIAVWLAVPAIYLVAIVTGTLGGFAVLTAQFHESSVGQITSLHWASQTLSDNAFSMIKTVVMTTAIALVAMYYGYRARGGPSGVGDATARSMMVNLILIHALGGSMTAIFWGDGGFAFGG